MSTDFSLDITEVMYYLDDLYQECKHHDNFVPQFIHLSRKK